MATKQTKIGYIGLALGGAALLLAVVHFWAGPFAPQASIGTEIADKAAAIRDSTLAALKGEAYGQEAASPWNADRFTQIIVAVAGGLAVILGVLAFVQNAPRRLAGTAVSLGIGALVFQFYPVYVITILSILLILYIISFVSLDFGA